jgi:hypothetical protein
MSQRYEGPVQGSTHGHTFCRHYIVKHFERSETCPTCRKPLENDNLLPNRSLCSLIEDAEVRCFCCESTDEGKKNGKKSKLRRIIDNGCEWIEKVKDAVSSHRQTVHMMVVMIFTYVRIFLGILKIASINLHLVDGVT